MISLLQATSEATVIFDLSIKGPRVHIFNNYSLVVGAKCCGPVLLFHFEGMGSPKPSLTV